MNKKLKFWQLMNKISVIQVHFVTYWVWMLVHYSITWQAKRRNMFLRRWNILIFKLDVCLFRPLKNKAFKDQFEKCTSLFGAGTSQTGSRKYCTLTSQFLLDNFILFYPNLIFIELVLPWYFLHALYFPHKS